MNEPLGQGTSRDGRTPPLGRPHAWLGEGLPYVDISDLSGKLITIEGTDSSGRSTQMKGLREWLEVQGYGVVETGWTRSKLMSEAIDVAKEGHQLNRVTFTLMYAIDFADRLENQIIPALKSGFVVLADRYLYTALARARVRGIDEDWVRALYGFAIQPDLVLYLRVGTDQLIRRVLLGDGIDYWEAGMDLNLGADPYDSFMAYQSRLLAPQMHERLCRVVRLRRVTAGDRRLRMNVFQTPSRTSINGHQRPSSLVMPAP